MTKAVSERRTGSKGRLPSSLLDDLDELEEAELERLGGAVRAIPRLEEREEGEAERDEQQMERHVTAAYPRAECLARGDSVPTAMWRGCVRSALEKLCV